MTCWEVVCFAILSIETMLSGAYPPRRRHICTRRSVSSRGKTPSTATSAACLARTTANHRLGNLLLVIAGDETTPPPLGTPPRSF
jgi:hypothetical protein